jgi:pimeloyl-ACP methyl ester carboxylesterase
MAFVNVNGVRLHYEDQGTGFPLVLCYSRGGNTTLWEPQIAAFSQRYRLIRWDPRGHGASEAPRDLAAYGQDVSVEDLRGLLDHLGIAQAYVGGLSMGGGISTRFTLTHRERVAALLVIDSGSAAGLAAGAETRAETRRTRDLAFSQGMDAVGRDAIATVASWAGRARRGPDAERQVLDTFRALDPWGYTNTLLALDEAPDFSGRLGEIAVPVLTIAGDEDPALEEVRFVHRQIHGSEFVLVPSAGHFSNLDQPEVFNREVLRFLAGADARRTAAAAARSG